MDGLRKLKNYQEVQTAYGQGSGTAAAARIAGDTELQRNLTDLRRLQMEADADTGMQLFDIFDTYRKRMDEETRDINRQRAEALFKEAEDEENNLYETQLQIGQELAKDGDYSILGKLYGWTQDQIDRVQGTGAYAPKQSSGGGGRYGGDDDEDYYKGWSNKDLQDKANQGVANHKANSTPLSSSAKKELAKPTVSRGSTSSSKKVM